MNTKTKQQKIELLKYADSQRAIKAEVREAQAKEQKLHIYDYLSAVRINDSNVNAMSTVKGGVWWVKIFVRLLQPIGLSVTGPRVHAIVILLRKVSKIGQKQGIKGLVIYLKACSVLLNQALGNHKIKDSGQLNCRVSRTNLGIPRFILAQDRKRIRLGDITLLKFYASFFAMYRVLDFPGKLKTASIEDPFKGDMEKASGLLIFVPHFISALNIPKIFGVDMRAIRLRYGQFADQFVPKMPAYDWLMNEYQGRLDLWIAKSAPGTHREGAQVSTHPIIMIRSAITIAKSDIYPAFRTFLDCLPPNHIFKWAFSACEKLAGVFKPLWSLGKIGIKEEAAGKVRLFAMVSAWYQMLLHPLHKLMFKILRNIPQDGTFDQLRPLQGHSDRFTEAYSLDLTAATDRLPLFIQQEIVKALIGEPLSKAWGSILVGISYNLASLKFGTYKLLKYAIGQPMGALSSWASLALTHHFLVQASAWKSGYTPVGKWFTDYAVLGDDLVIFREPVARQYLKILKDIGMEVGLHKSILSRDSNTLTVEFAKRVFHKGHDISPVPVLEFTSSLFDYGRLMEFTRKYRLTPVQIAKMLGFKFKAIAKLNSASFSSLNYKLRMLLISLQVPTTEEGAVSLLELGKPPVPNVRLAVGEILKTFTITEINGLLGKLAKIEKSQRESFGPFWNLDGDLINKLSSQSTLSKGDEEGWSGHISSRLHYLIVPWDSHIWHEHLAPIPGPAELKEVHKGWVMLPEMSEDKVFYPAFIKDPISRNALKDMRKTAVAAHLIPEKDVRDALRHLLDLLVLPPRQEAIALVKDVTAKLLDPRATPATVAAALVKVIENSREVALTPAVTADLIRHSPSILPKESIGMKLWKRWTPLIQGSVSLDKFLEPRKSK
jgi:hypothetical protein